MRPLVPFPVPEKERKACTHTPLHGHFKEITKLLAYPYEEMSSVTRNWKSRNKSHSKVSLTRAQVFNPNPREEETEMSVNPKLVLST